MNGRKGARPNTRLFYGEVVAPLTKLLDIQKVADMAHAAGAKLDIDNTCASPYVVKPLLLGADVVAHSLTKYINGHFDAIGGVLVADSETIDNPERLALKKRRTPAVRACRSRRSPLCSGTPL